MEHIGETIKRLRHDREWSQDRLAELMGTTGPSIGREERGFTPVHAPKQKRYAQAFGLSWEEWEREVQKTRNEISPVALYSEIEALLGLEARMFPSARHVVNAAIWLFSQSSPADKLKAVSVVSQIASGAGLLEGLSHQQQHSPPPTSKPKRQSERVARRSKR